MRVVLFNGSPKPKGTTAFALSLVAEEIEDAGIETLTCQVGARPVRGCLGCGRCRGLEPSRCVFDDDVVNGLIEAIRASDGVVLGAPTYYAGAAGQARAVLDRAFYAMSASDVRGKPCAVVSVARRAGTVTALDELLKYPTINEMPVVSSCYWPMAFGNDAEQAATDEEGVRIMRQLGRNMAWMLRSLEAARAAGIEMPAQVMEGVRTNFVRE